MFSRCTLKAYPSAAARIRSLDTLVVAVAPDKLTAEMWMGLLRNEGIHCSIHPGDSLRYNDILFGYSTTPVRIIVRDSDAPKAAELLQVHFDAAAGPDAAGAGQTT